MPQKPDFIVVGPQKTGTTWLYYQLREIDGVYMPPAKELSFFSDADTNDFCKEYKRGKKELKGNYFDLVNSGQQLQSLLKSQGESRIRNFKFAWKYKSYLWALWYILIPRKLNKISFLLYSRLFRSNKTTVAGDISPAYFALSNKAIAAIKANFPRLKVVFIVRDPVEREWSQIKDKFYNGEDTPYFKTKEEFLNNYNPQSDYRNAIENWGSTFPKEQILYLSYRQLNEDPAAFIKQMLSFLGVKESRYNLIKEKINQGKPVAPTADVNARLKERNNLQYKYLNSRFGDGFLF